MSRSSLFQAVLNTVKWNPEVQDYCLLLLYYQNAMQISWGMCSLLAVSTGEIKLWFCLGCCGCCRHWLNANLNCVLLHRKDQEQFEIACGQLSLSCFMFPLLHWLLISALLLTSMWLRGYRNLRTCVICLICKMQLIYLLQQCVELLITPGDSNYLTD